MVDRTPQTRCSSAVRSERSVEVTRHSEPWGKQEYPVSPEGLSPFWSFLKVTLVIPELLSL